MPDSVDSLFDLLRYLQSSRLHEVFPNVSVALHVVLTIPVTVASGERSFSKSKLIKTYLRASMKQDRLNGLALGLLSIENAVASELDYSSVIEKFASLKARRVRIQYNTIQYKTCNAPYVTKMLFVGAGMTRD